MSYRIAGRITEAETHDGIEGVIVSAFDKDRLRDDFLAEAMTDADGRFAIEYSSGAFAEPLEGGPDLFVTVKTRSGERIFTTAGAVRFEAGPRQTFQLEIPRDLLVASGLRARDDGAAAPGGRATLTCLDGADDDELVRLIRFDLEAAGSPLALMDHYRERLAGSWNNDAIELRKLARLFELGRTPGALEGHHYGMVPGLRTGDLSGVAGELGNLVGAFWGQAIGPTAPWSGKTFAPMAAADRAQAIGDSVPDAEPVSRGINHFNRIEGAGWNVAATLVLGFAWHLRESPAEERKTYGHERNGGHFAAHRARSIHPTTPREVLRLNYRHRGLDNNPPLTHLVDELVEMADGLYLGQVLFATDRLLEAYDPSALHERYQYQHFGYFVLFDRRWNAEARRLFPHLEIPEAAVEPGPEGEPGPVPREPRLPAKLRTLTLSDPFEGKVDAAALAEVRRDLAGAGDVMAMLKSYSDALDRTPRNRSAIFDKLFALFQAGIAPTRMDGFHRGARVTFRTHGPLSGLGTTNTLNLLWRAAQHLSPWTGKRFEPIGRQALAEITDGHETMSVPTFFGSNTVVFRTAGERLIGRAIRLVRARTVAATDEERRRHGYDATCFFFIARHASSVLAENYGRPVFQFNYRWKRLHTPPPDNYCMDEVVQIADGLYLGQLTYATRWWLRWKPSRDPASYRYRVFGYFLLMDEEWHARRLQLGFDPGNA
jgi:hypothetical protein